MCARIAGRRGTPDRVVQLLKEEVGRTSQAATARATGLTLRGVQNYLKGIGEPTQATMQKLALYFWVTVPWLRGGPVGPLERFIEGLQLAGYDNADAFKTKLDEGRGRSSNSFDILGEFLSGCANIDPQSSIKLCKTFGINYYWVKTGHTSVRSGGGVVGTVDNGSVLDEEDDPLVVTCAKCGETLDIGSEPHGPLEVWPCKTCCK